MRRTNASLIVPTIAPEVANGRAGRDSSKKHQREGAESAPLFMSGCPADADSDAIDMYYEYTSNTPHLYGCSSSRFGTRQSPSAFVLARVAWPCARPLRRWSSSPGSMKLPTYHIPVAISLFVLAAPQSYLSLPPQPPTDRGPDGHHSSQGRMPSRVPCGVPCWFRRPMRS